MNEEFENYQELAKAYLAKKERKNYYVTKGICEPYPDYCDYLAELTDDEAKQIRALKEQYGKEFINHLNEVIDDEDVIHDMFYGEPVDIDLDDLRHQYTFTIREVNGDEVTMTRKILVELTDNEYIKLLAWHLYDSHLVMNTLFYRDEQLCKRIMRESMRYVCDDDAPMITHPFVFTMDEALDDTEKIRQENGLIKTSGSVGLFF